MKRVSSQEFLQTRRTESTRRSYRWSFNYCIGGDPDGFLELVRKDRKKAEQKIIRFILAERDRVKPSTVRNPISAV
ncbi:MAG: hypothetical protein O7B30_04095, partial [Thaumarchaeota archaeon]|nr:hypothetical protein [Nitrososphaerota archaeon]